MTEEKPAEQPKEEPKRERCGTCAHAKSAHGEALDRCNREGCHCRGWME